MAFLIVQEIPVDFLFGLLLSFPVIAAKSKLRECCTCVIQPETGRSVFKQILSQPKIGYAAAV